MRSTFAITLLASVVSAKGLLGLPLDIGALLSSLGPAPANDPRWTDFHPAGTGDGTPPLIPSSIISLTIPKQYVLPALASTP